MAVPSDNEILSLLDCLEEQPAAMLESQWLDFKSWEVGKRSMRAAVEYAVCLANAEGGCVVFGVDDQATGRSQAIHGIGKYDPDTWKRGVFEATRPSIEVELTELSVPEGTGTLLVMRVPTSSDGPHGTSNGLYQMRVGKNCMPLDPAQWARVQVSTGAVDWSGQTAAEASQDDLDAVEIARARNIIRRFRPESDLARFSDADLLTGVGAIRNGQVTHAGLLLFARVDALKCRCPQHLVQYVYQVSETDVARNDVLQTPLLNIVEQIESAFAGPANPERELTVGMFKLRVPAYPVEVVREAVLNAVTHRDYSDPGKVLVRHAVSELVVTSPGRFLADITPQNILRHEPLTRNPTLASAFLKLGLVEQAGMGRKRIFIPLLSYGKRAPHYETDGVRVILRIFDGGFDESMARLVAQWSRDGRDVGLDGLLVLSYLRDHAFIDTAAASRLLQLGLDDARGVLDRLALPATGILERRGKTRAGTYHLCKAIAKDLLGKTAYTKTRGIDEIRYVEMVKAFVEHHGTITPAECRELVGLGESRSAREQVSRLLRNWSGEDGFLRREGRTRTITYFPR